MASLNLNTAEALFYYPSDILHSKDLSPAILTQTRDHSDPIPAGLVICHKDKFSFYKSTRKVGRIAKRLLSHTVSCGVNEVDNINAYWVSNHNEDKNVDDEGTVIRRRLESEFGPSTSIDLQINLDEHIEGMGLHALKLYSSNETSLQVQNEDVASLELHVVFLDLDHLIHSLLCKSGGQDGGSFHCQLLDAVLTSLSNKNIGGGNIVIHVKCDHLYKIMNDVAKFKSQSYVAKSDLQAYYLKQQQSTNGQNNESLQDDSSSKQSVIRRLQQHKSASNCPLSVYPIRYIQNPVTKCLVEICRFHNYDADRGCLRSKRRGGCEMDHDHCHLCGKVGHRGFECVLKTTLNSGSEETANSLEPMVFVQMKDGTVKMAPVSDNAANSTLKLPALIIIGGRLRGRTLASCEILPLSNSNDVLTSSKEQWIKMPNLLEHRGSHAACSPPGTGLIFVMGGGGVDGNLDTVECFSFKSGSSSAKDTISCLDERWQTMNGKLSSPRHAFGSVACVSKMSKGSSGSAVSLFAVGGWKYGSVSCESVDKFTFDPLHQDMATHQWETCAPLLRPRRLHSVVASIDGSSIYVFGGYIDERFTTSSIEMYDIAADQWHPCEELPYGNRNCPLVQAVPDWSQSNNSFLIFPFGSENGSSSSNTEILRYTPGSNNPFSPVLVPSKDEGRGEKQTLNLPLKNWASFSATSWSSQLKAYLVGGTIDGKWTARGFELDLLTMKWSELPEMQCARRRSVALVVE